MEPLNEPSISHPQTTPAPVVTGTRHIPAGRVHLGRHRQQRPGQRAQHTRFGHRRTWLLPRTARRRAPRLLHVRCRLAGAVLGRQGTALFGRSSRVTTLRMAGLPVRNPLRRKGLSITPSLRMVEVACVLPLRMAGVFWGWR
jgi:hypothetical protein